MSLNESPKTNTLPPSGESSPPRSRKRAVRMVGRGDGPKRKRAPLPPSDFLNECLSYDPESGIVRWKARPQSHFQQPGKSKTWLITHAGKQAGTYGTDEGGYRYTNIFLTYQGLRQPYILARIIFALNGVEIPDHLEVDHIDRNGWNNRWSNLRIVTSGENKINRGRWLNKEDRGVWFEYGGWRAVLYRQYKSIEVGKFDTKEEAIQARRTAEQHYERNRTNCRAPREVGGRGPSGRRAKKGNPVS